VGVTTQPLVGAAPSPVTPKRRRWRGVAALVAVLLAVLVVRAEVAAPTRVSSESMAPTIAKGRVVLVDKLSWRLRGLERGQFVEFRGFHDQPMLKRVVGLGGDVVEIRDARLYVNDERVRELYVDHSRVDGEYFGPVRVPAGQLFVLGDNRGRSIDSRSFGPVDESAVIGTAAVGLWPVGALG
jgi:signal peptidase I